MKKCTALLAAVVLCLAMAAHAADETKPAGEPAKAAAAESTVKGLDSTESQFSYIMGYQFARSVAGRLPVKLDMDAFKTGMQEGTEGKDSRISEERQEALFSELKSKVEAEVELAKKADEKFLAENKKKKGVKTTDSGLQLTTVKEGSGATPKANDKVKLHYKGTLVNGAEFDNSAKHEGGGPAEFSVGGLIAGFSEGLQLMKVGGKYQLAIPGDLAYGPNPPGPPITPNATLLFEVELVDILPPAAAPAAGALEGLDPAPAKK